MNNKELLPSILDNLDVFHLMTLSGALISSYNCKESDRDTMAVIEYIGGAYKISAELTEAFGRCILGDMMNIGLVTDYHALSATEYLDGTDTENMELYELKGRVLEEAAATEGYSCSTADPRTSNQARAAMKYDYFHHAYNGKMRFRRLKETAESGNVNAVRELGLFYALGIGCERDFKKAEKCFLKCILWGDGASARLLAYLYGKTGEDENRERGFYLLADVAAGEAEFTKTDVKSEAQKIYSLAGMIRCVTLITGGSPYVNHWLADEILSDKTTYKQKRELIAAFGEKNVKNVLFNRTESGGSIGFRVNKNE